MIQQVAFQVMCATRWITDTHKNQYSRCSYQYNSKSESVNNTSAHGKIRGCMKRNTIDPLIEFYAVKMRMLIHAIEWICLPNTMLNEDHKHKRL